MKFQTWNCWIIGYAFFKRLIYVLSWASTWFTGSFNVHGLTCLPTLDINILFMLANLIVINYPLCQFTLHIFENLCSWKIFQVSTYLNFFFCSARLFTCGILITNIVNIYWGVFAMYQVCPSILISMFHLTITLIL